MSSTLCECGHAKSQHVDGVCDYEGYACYCNGYRLPGSRPRTKFDDACAKAAEMPINPALLEETQ